MTWPQEVGPPTGSSRIDLSPHRLYGPSPLGLDGPIIKQYDSPTVPPEGVRRCRLFTATPDIRSCT